MEMPRTIKVTGKGNVSLKPDECLISLDFSKVEKDYASALKRSSDDAKEIKKALTSLGLAKDSLKTNRFDVDSKYEYYKDNKGNSQHRFVGYEYNQSLRFAFDIDNKLLGKVLFALGELDVNPRIGISYRIKDQEAGKNLLLKDAINDAKKKAKIIAEASDVTLGDILNIDYSIMDIEFTSRFTEMRCDMLMASSNSYDVDFEPEDIKKEDSVTLTFAIK